MDFNLTQSIWLQIMKTLLKIEEFAQFIVCVVLLALFNHPWWAYILLLIAPDIGMAGYLINRKAGAWLYNAFHHKGLAIAIGFSGLLFTTTPLSDVVWHTELPIALTAMIILYGHASMDRAFGIGLKHEDDFKNTHLGRMGKA
jgi:hypothetical protein